MSEATGGKGAAYNATVETSGPRDAAELGERRLAQALHRVEVATAKVERQREHLAGATAELAAAEAALEELD